MVQVYTHPYPIKDKVVTVIDKDGKKNAILRSNVSCISERNENYCDILFVESADIESFAAKGSYETLFKLIFGD